MIKLYYYFHRFLSLFKKVLFSLGGIKMGHHIYIGPRVRLEGRVNIGSHVYFSQDVVVAAKEGVKIGDHTMLGEFTSVRDSDHTDVLKPQELISKPVVIGQKVWLGRGVAVLKGVTIGDNCVIGANSVVTKDIPPNSIAAGVPAVVIRQR